MRASRRHWWWLSIFLLLTLTAGGSLLILWLRAQTPLLARATRITSVDTAASFSYPHLADTLYLWRSDCLLLLRRQMSQSKVWPVFSVVQRDCTTGMETPLPALNKPLSHWTPVPRSWRWNTTSLSPDGRWLLLEYGGGMDELPFDAIDLSTGRAITGMSKVKPLVFYPFSNTLWLPDGRRWMFLALDLNGLCVVQQGFARSDTQRGADFGFPPGTACGIDCFYKPRLLGFIDKERVLVLPGAGVDPLMNLFIVNDRLPLYEVQIGKHPNIHEHPIRLPAGSQLLDAALNPCGDRLAWLVRVRFHPSPMLQLLGRWLPSLHVGSQEGIELYTTRLDGSDKRTLGFLPAPTLAQEQKHIRSLCWLPSGKRLSFIYKDALYTVPAD